MRKRVRFLQQFLADPSAVGAVAPSSHALARSVVSCLDLSNIQSVVEYGPGYGSLTTELLSRLPDGARFFAVERNPQFAIEFRKRHPRATLYLDCVTNIKTHCRSEGIEGVDCIMSGLPWSIFPDDLQTRILDTTMDVLEPGGQFVTFVYVQSLMLPAGVRFRRKLESVFRKVRQSHTVWMNLPPAVVYQCRL